MEFYLLLAVVGLAGGFFAGWVGLGGGIILAPLLLYVPPALGLDPLDIKAGDPTGRIVVTRRDQECAIVAPATH